MSSMSFTSIEMKKSFVGQASMTDGCASSSAGTASSWLRGLIVDRLGREELPQVERSVLAHRLHEPGVLVVDVTQLSRDKRPHEVVDRRDLAAVLAVVEDQPLVRGMV